jgi:hypothetical protein
MIVTRGDHRVAPLYRRLAWMAKPPRRFRGASRANKMPGGYVVRDANAQAIAVYPRDGEAEASQAKVAHHGRGATPPAQD